MITYLSTLVGGCGIIFGLVGLIGGRIVGLEGAAVIQLAFLSLTTLKDMTPCFRALLGLSYSCGYNSLKDFDATSKVASPIKGIRFEDTFSDNYNIMSLMVFLPLLIALITRLMIHFDILKSRHNMLKLIGGYSLY